MNVITLAKELIDIPSVTGEERDVLLRLEELCSGMGMHVRLQMITPQRWNLFADWDDEADIVFCTHVDTVPPYFPSYESEGLLYGRGACDTKGIIAAMLSAVALLKATGESPSFLFVVGEETDSIGAKEAVNNGKRARYIIVGEPTGNTLASGHKGVMSYTLHCTGRAGHSAYTDAGNSAIHAILDVLGTIRTHDWGYSDILGEATLNVGMIQGGVAMNTFAPSAAATVIHRIVDDVELRKTELTQLVTQTCTIDFHSLSQPQMLHCVPGFDAAPVNFGTDIPWLSRIGRCLLMGPGSIHDAHTEDEKISIAELEHAVNEYVRLYRALKNE